MVDLFADIEDAKTKKKLFNPKAQALVKTTLKHIQKGCLSDIPGEAYYLQIREDSLGLPVYSCIRGTNALEGFHQKIRQLIRGFNISPRIATGQLFAFTYRWNADIDVRMLGLDKKYKSFYNGWEVEEDIQITARWNEMAENPHPTWRSTQDYECTGETFGLNKAGFDSTFQILSNETDNLAEPVDDRQLENEAALFVDAINDGIVDGPIDLTSEDGPIDLTSEDVLCSSQVLSESALWVSEQLGVSRSSARVQTDSEKKFFQNHVLTFQRERGTSSEADNFSAIEFGAFSRFWNAHIQEEELGRREKTDMTLKSTFQLQLYWKQFRKDTNTAATMLPIHERNQSLRREWRHGTTRDVDVAVAPAEMAQDRVLWVAPAASAAASVNVDETADDDDFSFGDIDCDGSGFVDSESILPSLEAGKLADSRNDDGSEAVVVGNGDKNGEGTAATDTSTVVATAVRLTKQRKPRKGARCSKCGLEYSKASPYGMYHKGLGKRGKDALQPRDVCTVPESQRILNSDGTLPTIPWYQCKT